MYGMFYQVSPSFTGTGLESWDVSNVTNMAIMFNNASALVANLSAWNTSRVKSMFNMFSGALSFNGNLSLWDTSQVTDMSAMFSGAFAFQGYGLNDWNVSRVETMTFMFYGAKRFDSNLSAWDVSNVKDMSNMFAETESFGGVGLENWNVSQVSKTSYMFVNAVSFHANLSNWEVSNLHNMFNMFENASSFEGVSWYKNVLVKRFDLSKHENIYCEDGVDNVCEASTSCWSTNMTLTAWQDYVNETFFWDNSIYLANITMEAGIVSISTSELDFTFRFPRDCSVTCSGVCFCDGCYYEILQNMTL
jgi:surface protein